MTSARRGLPKSRRLLRSAEFAATLQGNLRWRDEFFGVHAVSSSYPHGRLGIVVSRKVSHRAVTRNRIKRQIRESFRQNQMKLGGLDIVVVAGPKAAKVKTAFLRASLQQLWDKVEQQCGKS